MNVKKKICPKLGLRSRSKLKNNSFMAVLAYIYFLIIRKDFTCSSIVKDYHTRQTCQN